MSKIRVGINGAGRIGRYLVRLMSQTNLPIELVALNSTASIEQVAHLIQYDSVHKTFSLDVKVEGSYIQIGSSRILYSRCRNIEDISWKGVDLVVDATGIYKTKEDLKKHIQSDVKKVLLAAPGKDLDWTVVFGVNHQDYEDSKHSIISNASCTTNCLAPLVMVIDQELGIEEGYMTTIHAYTGDQKLLDSSHKDLRRARAAGLSMIPTSTGATQAIGEVLPQLQGRLKGLSIRVPVANVSLVELVVRCKKDVSLKGVRTIFESYTQKHPQVLHIEDQPLVSQDFIGSSYSSVIDFELTQCQSQTLQLLAWYDNESGYSHRVLDVISHIYSSSLYKK